MESKPKTSTAAIREKWTNYEEQTGMQYLIVAGGDYHGAYCHNGKSRSVQT